MHLCYNINLGVRCRSRLKTVCGRSTLLHSSKPRNATELSCASSSPAGANIALPMFLQLGVIRRCRLPVMVPLFRPHSCTLRRRAFRIAALRVCFAVREDDRSFYIKLYEETGHIADHEFHRVWDAIKPMLARNGAIVGRTLYNVPDNSGRSSFEGGQERPYAEMLHACHALQQDQIGDLRLCLSLSQLPSRLDVEGRFQNLSVNRAPGMDGLSPTLLRAQEFAEPLFHPAFKVWMTGHEPLQFKGGLHSISKKVMCHDVANMRGIMLIDVVGKISHSLLRQRFWPSLLNWRYPFQLGRFPNCSTMFATHCLRAVQERANDLKLSSAVLFIDVKSAFRSMIRQLLLGDDQPLPAHLCLADVGYDVSALHKEIAQQSTEFIRDVPICEQCLLQDAHAFTWFCLAGSADSFCASRGSRPGSPLAD
eukprot:s189_g20.t1